MGISEFISIGILIFWIGILIANIVLDVQIRKTYNKYNNLLEEQNDLLKRILGIRNPYKEEK